MAVEKVESDAAETLKVAFSVSKHDGSGELAQFGVGHTMLDEKDEHEAHHEVDARQASLDLLTTFVSTTTTPDLPVEHLQCFPMTLIHWQPELL